MTTISNVSQGSVYTITPQKNDNESNSQRTALSQIVPDKDKGEFLAKVSGDNHTFVFDLRQSSFFVISGQKIKLKVPKSDIAKNQSVRFVVEYRHEEDKEYDVSVSSEFNGKRTDYEKLKIHTDIKESSHSLKASKTSQVNAKNSLSSHAYFVDQFTMGMDKDNSSKSAYSHRVDVRKAETPISEKDFDIWQLLREAHSYPQNMNTLIYENQLNTLKEAAMKLLKNCRNWDDVADITNVVAVTRGVPDFSNKVRDLTRKLITSEYVKYLQEAGIYKNLDELQKDVINIALIPHVLENFSNLSSITEQIQDCVPSNEHLDKALGQLYAALDSKNEDAATDYQTYAKDTTNPVWLLGTFVRSLALIEATPVHSEKDAHIREEQLIALTHLDMAKTPLIQNLLEDYNHNIQKPEASSEFEPLPDIPVSTNTHDHYFSGENIGATNVELHPDHDSEKIV